MFRFVLIDVVVPVSSVISASAPAKIYAVKRQGMSQIILSVFDSVPPDEDLKADTISPSTPAYVIKAYTRNSTMDKFNIICGFAK